MTTIKQFKEDLMKIVTHLGDQKEGGGSFAIAFRPDDKTVPWSVSYEFGQEAPLDSDMAGGVSYGIGQTEEQAVRAVVEDLGL